MFDRKIDQYLKPTGEIEVKQWAGKDKEPVPVMVPDVDIRMRYDLAVADTARRYMASAIREAAEDVGQPEAGDEFPWDLVQEDKADDLDVDLVGMFSDDVAAEMRRFAFTLDPQSVGRVAP